ncbi:hypothetical protein F7725_007681 [Dissostichus mawsoni]|uniref:Uncharacterized protein n=1 Tax=Dissostichus mawsoni TaxID=36200 RepID=A0A7J5Y852_DISMA|nr:hypothetical protein F7725_007681 [Dissostichus mawsoni]
MEVASGQSKHLSISLSATIHDTVILHNRFTTLSDDPVHPADAPALLSDPSRSAPCRHCNFCASSRSVGVASQAPVESTRRPSSRLATSSSQRRLLKEAVLRRSGSFPGPEPARKSSPSPAVVNRLIVHVGSNDTARQQSELTKNDFDELFNSDPTLARGAGRFSRTLSLHTWLQSACRAYNLGFIDNLYLFLDRAALFGTDEFTPAAISKMLL